MNYSEFVYEVQEAIMEEVKDNLQIYVEKTLKNNGVYKTGLTISDCRSKVSPRIYMEEFYEEYKKGKSINAIVKKILYLYNKVKIKEPWDEDLCMSFLSVKEKVVIRLLNYDRNEEWLKSVPHMRYLDMVVVFYVYEKLADGNKGFISVTNDHLDIWGTDLYELLEVAKKNTPLLFPKYFRTMEAALGDLFLVPFQGVEDTLYVLSNTDGEYGATTMLYDGILEEIGDFLGEDYYVIPSSIHEVLISRVSTSPTLDILSDMVWEVNGSELCLEDILADQAYYYDRKEKLLYMQ